MASVYNVADFFIDVAKNSTDDPMTNLKLNKLLYYAQGLYLARTGIPLFPEVIQAWKHGPVVPAVYHRYKAGNTPIRKVSSDYSYENFSPDELDVLIDVMKEKGQYTGSKLIEMTHNESPWRDVYIPDVYNIEITKDSMKAYFTEHPIKPFTISSRRKVVSAVPAEYYNPADDGYWGN